MFRLPLRILSKNSSLPSSTPWPGRAVVVVVAVAHRRREQVMEGTVLVSLAEGLGAKRYDQQGYRCEQRDHLGTHGITPEFRCHRPPTAGGAAMLQDYSRVAVRATGDCLAAATGAEIRTQQGIRTLPVRTSELITVPRYPGRFMNDPGPGYAVRSAGTGVRSMERRDSLGRPDAVPALGVPQRSPDAHMGTMCPQPRESRRSFGAACCCQGRTCGQPARTIHEARPPIRFRSAQGRRRPRSWHAIPEAASPCATALGRRCPGRNDPRTVCCSSDRRRIVEFAAHQAGG